MENDYDDNIVYSEEKQWGLLAQNITDCWGTQGDIITVALTQIAVMYQRINNNHTKEQ